MRSPAAPEALRRWDELEAATAAFRDSLFGSSMPPEIIDAVAGTLGVLRSATVIRLEGGELWGWEGQHIGEGSCEGSCTHVWNYQQALAWLFPALERTLRETEFAYNQLPNGGLTFRQRLPLGSGFDVIGPCADGHFGATIKAYREWRNSGDDAWLKRYWPNIRRSIEYAWSPDNPDRWDPDKTGVLWGRQHHTLDMELFGPNSWLTSMYLAALKAAAEMARADGRTGFRRGMRGAWRRRAGLTSTASFSTAAITRRSSSSTIARSLEPFDKGRKAGVLRDMFHAGLLVGRIRRDQISDRRRLSDRPDSRTVARRPRRPRRSLIARKCRCRRCAAIYRENFRPILKRSFQSVPGLRL